MGAVLHTGTLPGDLTVSRPLGCRDPGLESGRGRACPHAAPGDGPVASLQGDPPGLPWMPPSGFVTSPLEGSGPLLCPTDHLNVSVAGMSGRPF